MIRVNENYTRLQASYLFSEIGTRVQDYQDAHPDREIIKLGIGDVTQALVPAITEAMHKAVDEMGMQVEFTKVSDYADIMQYAILTTPGLVINEKVVCSGRIPTQAEVTTWLSDAAMAEN